MQKNKLIKIAAVILTVAILLGVSGCGLFGDKYTLTAEQYARYQKYEKLDKTLRAISDEYYKEVDEGAILEGAARGMVDSLGDEYSYYMNAEEFKQLQRQSLGTFYGIGVRFTKNENKQNEVVEVIAGGGAEAAGILAGDLLMKADDVDLAPLVNDEVVAAISGDENTIVHIVVQRGNEQLEFDVKRGPVNQTSVSHTLMENNIGYIYISSFYLETPNEFRGAVADLKTQGAQGIIIDLRNNLGGVFESALDIADQILPQCRILSVESRGESIKVFESDAANIELPLVMLVNGYSASASEVLTGAIRDNNAAVVVGENTFGKGLVQVLKQIDGTDGFLRITIQEYVTPSGAHINGVGIPPDYEVFLADAIINGEEALTNENDTQLIKAREVIQELINAQ